MTEVATTKDRILDSAEKLFAMNGFDSTSLREITTDAGANLAAVNYHFQSKDSLINAVIGRRVAPINRRRLEMLAAWGENPTVEQILEAWMRPALEAETGPLMPLIGRIFSSPKDLVQVSREHFSEIAKRFGQAMAKALPGLTLEELHWRQNFMVGTMAQVLCWAPILPELTGGVCSMDDREAVIGRLVTFLAAGFRAPLPEKAGKKAVEKKD